MIVKNQSLGPRHPKYLPAEVTGYPCCGSVAPEDVFGVAWRCTREIGHEGDHAAHHDLGRTGKDDPVVMVARWDQESSDD